jgi:ATP-dependent Clp protease ATP-binding subunit ClpC
VDFRNTIVLMTSNVGAEMLRKQGSLGFVAQKESTTYEDMKTRLLEEVKKTFKPEFLNRVDEIIVFKGLTKENLYDIVKIEVDGVVKRLKDKDIEIELSKEAIDLLVEKGFDPIYGARPLKRTIQRLLEDPLAEDIISGQSKEHHKIKVERKGDALAFNQ